MPQGVRVRMIFAKAQTMRDYEKGKRVEVRLWSSHLDQIYEGQYLTIASATTKITRRVVRKVQYRNFEKLVLGENFSDVFPGVLDERTFKERVSQYFSLDEIRDKPLLAFELASC